MRERTAELGGTFLLDAPAAGGTRIVAWLPIHPELPADQLPGSRP
jgi:signal transduction histidine kinase